MMCGRYALFHADDFLTALYRLAHTAPVPRRFNIAPGSQAPFVRAVGDERELALGRWGLLPFWAKDDKLSYRTFNARGETAASKPSFRAAFRARPALVPADAYYEWTREDGAKQPHAIHRMDKQPLTFAGMWDRWKAPDGQQVDSFTILTRPADPTIAHLHDRMPVMLQDDLWEAWLDAELTPEKRTDLLMQAPMPPLGSYRVDPKMNNARYESPDCLRSIEEGKGPGGVAPT